MLLTKEKLTDIRFRLIIMRWLESVRIKRKDCGNDVETFLFALTLRDPMAFGLPSVLHPILSTKGSVCVYNQRFNTVHLLHIMIILRV
jgi:hypothetical protein